MKRLSSNRPGISRVKVVVIVIALILVVVAGAVLYYLPVLKTAYFPAKGGGSLCGSAPAGTATVKVGMLLGAGGPFNPENITVVVGVNNTITWTNNDPKSEHHTVTLRGDASALNSGDMGAGAAFTCSFTTPGTYNYYCVYHPLQFGTIVVKAH